MGNIGKLSIDMLISAELKDEIKRAAVTIRKVQETLYTLTEGDDKKQTGIRAGTVLTFALINKLSGDKNADSLTEDDWKEIAESVIDNAVLLDESKYSKLVFLTYADYIDASALSISRYLSEEKTEAITSLSAEIRKKSEELERGIIEEKDCIEDCLWISLEAMVKILASTLEFCTGPDLGKLTYAVSILAFEYGRMTLYRQEKDILTAYIENQYLLNDELEKKYEQYIKNVEKQSATFNNLIENAFNTDCRTMLRESAELAKAAGVDESELLKTTEEIDDFFM